MARTPILTDLREACALFGAWLCSAWRLFWRRRSYISIHVEGTRIALHSYDTQPQAGTTWHGNAYFAFWNGRLPFNITTLSRQPDDGAISLLQAALRAETPRRMDIERAIYKEYQAEIAGNYDFSDGTGQDVTESVAPTVESESEFLALISQPEVSIADWDAQEMAYTVRFDCPWNMRGIDVRIIDGKIDQLLL